MRYNFNIQVGVRVCHHTPSLHTPPLSLSLSLSLSLPLSLSLSLSLSLPLSLLPLSALSPRLPLLFLFLSPPPAGVLGFLSRNQPVLPHPWDGATIVGETGGKPKLNVDR